MGTKTPALLLAMLALPAAVHAAAVRGRVRLSGPKPPASATKVLRDKSVCGAEQPDVSVVVSADAGLANVVVSAAEAAPAPTPDDASAVPDPIELVLDQRNCRFEPRVVAARRGRTLTLVNSDAVLHNAHARSADRTVFNTPFPIKNLRRTVTLRDPGLLTVGCDAGHDWMRAYVHVFEHPQFAVTGTDGRFVLELPPGAHTLRMWHEKLGVKDVPIAVTADGASLDLELAFPPRAAN